MTRLHKDSVWLAEKYREADTYLKKMHLHCFSQHLEDQLPNPFIENPENSFLSKYLSSHEDFKKECNHLSILLRGEIQASKIINKYEVDSSEY